VANRDRETYDSYARSVGPETSREAARNLKRAFKEDVWSVFLDIEPCTLWDLTIEMIRRAKRRGETLYQDPISGAVNTLQCEGRIVPTGERKLNEETGRDAKILRRATREEKEWVLNYRGSSTTKAPWCGGDTMMDVLENYDELYPFLKEILDDKDWDLYVLFRKGHLWRGVYKEKGIDWFRDHYDLKGKRRDH